MEVLSSFCGILTLQVGAAILSIVIFTLAGIILAANIFIYHNSSDGWPLNLILMIIFVISIIIIGVFMFGSAYSEIRRWAIISVIGLIILLCYWIILCCFSFFGTSDHVGAICIDTRCPESFWIANLNYRRQHSGGNTSPSQSDTLTMHNDTSPAPSPSPTPMNISTTLQSKRRRRHDDLGYLRTGYRTPVYEYVQTSEPKHHKTWKRQNHHGDIGGHRTSYGTPFSVDIQASEPKHHKTWKRQNHHGDIGGHRTGYGTPFSVDVQGSRAKRQDRTHNATKDDDDDKLHGIVHGFPFSGAVVLFFANLLFLIYTTLIMWSWASELDWADYYVEEDPGIIYEEDRL